MAVSGRATVAETQSWVKAVAGLEAWFFQTYPQELPKLDSTGYDEPYFPLGSQDPVPTYGFQDPPSVISLTPV